MPNTEFHENNSDVTELAWELKQDHPDTHRIKYFLEDVHVELDAALRVAGLSSEQILRNAALRQLNLKRFLRNL